MRQYLLKRLLLLVPVLLGVSLVAFGIIHLIPGDVVVLKLGEGGHLRPEEIARLRQQLGLDRPLHEQYLVWVANVLRGDLGTSVWTEKPVLAEIVRRLPVTAELALLAMAAATIIAVPAGLVSAARQDSALDHLARLASILGLSVPGFWLGTALIVFPAIWFGWTPPIGYVSLVESPLLNLQQFALPALALGAAQSATLTRMIRSSMLEVLHQDYIRTAWAKGLRERVVLTRHALKNALIPVITLAGNQLGFLLSGTVIMEQIFALPGIGRLTLDAILQRDYPQLQGNILFVASAYVFINLGVDLLYAWLDPRIKYA